MTMTNAASAYFAKNAGQWDSLRSGYFSEAVRQAAIARAYLRPDMAVADIGSGTGFIAAGLAPLVHTVHVLDGSPEMLETARRNLAGFSNVIYHQADGAALPLPDASLDAVFANMYLHHCPDPLAAIREMARLLRPGGRLVITDMDTHSFEWMRLDMADEWLGFDRQQMHAWFEQADLVNRIVASTEQNCCAAAPAPAGQAVETEPLRDAQITIFVAVGTRPQRGASAAVQSHYADIAEGNICGCGAPAQADQTSSVQTGSSSTSCCSPQEGLVSLDELIVTTYNPADLANIPPEAADISLGCGNPLALANLQPGQAVLDIGSGGGIDAFLAAQKVGSGGRVIGVDMTPEMLAKARRSARNAGYANVEFRQGQADSLPLEAETIDLVISNCVINLVEDKGRAFGEAYRVLKPGGRLSISDIVANGSFPYDMAANSAGWASCITGALPEKEYIDLVAQAGFKEIKTVRSADAFQVGDIKAYSLLVSAVK